MVRTIINSTKTRRQPMPNQCEICGNYKAEKKENRDITDSTKNKCFKQWERGNNKYAPFTNSKREIELTCNEFSHMRVLKAW